MTMNHEGVMLKDCPVLIEAMIINKQMSKTIESRRLIALTEL